MSKSTEGFIASAAISAIVVAAITTFGTIAVSEPEAQKVKKELEALLEIEKISNLPIGTITPSMLTPTLFSDAVGDPSVFNSKRSKWVIADGEEDITLSRYGKLLNKR